MSGRTIGSAVGFVVGMYFGNPQLGMMIGGMIGGAVDPDKVQGTKIGELPVQRSLTGGVQPVVLGTSLVDQCLIMWAGQPRVVTEEEDPGKGSGTVVENEVMYQDYRIRVCRSSAADGSQVQGFPVIFEDGRLVYDMRENPRISRADSAKWAANVTFYYGGAAQEPDPTEEAAVGVGNASAHRQIASFVKKNQKMTDFGNRIPTYEVVVSKCALIPQNYLLVTGYPKTEGGPTYAQALATQDLAFSGIPQSTGATETGICAYYNGDWVVANANSIFSSSDNRQTWASVPSPSFGESVRTIVGGTAGWLAHAATSRYWHAGEPAGEWTSEDTYFRNSISYARGKYWSCWAGALYRSDSPYGPWDEVVSTPPPVAGVYYIYSWLDIIEHGVHLYAATHHIAAYTAGLAYGVVRSDDGGETWSDPLVWRTEGSGHEPCQLASDGNNVIAFAAGGGVWTSANGWGSWVDTGIVGEPLVTGGFSLTGRKITAGDGKAFTIGYSTVGAEHGDLCVVTQDGGLTWSSPAVMPIGNAISIAYGDGAVDGGGIELPDAPGYHIDPITGAISGPASDVGLLCGTTLSEVVQYICHRGQLTDAEIGASELEGIPVRGITLQSAGTCKDELDPLRQTHFFDPADFDGKLRFRLRGAEAVDMVIDPDDLVLTDDDDDENRIIGQEVEFSRKHWFNYLSLDLDYLRTGAPSERTALDPSVVGESEAQANEVFSHEEAMRISAIQHRLLWMGQEGYRKFGLPLEYIGLTGASLISLDGRRGRIDGYSIDLNAIWFDPVTYDRASAYTANVVAPVLTPPTGPATGIRGPTISAILNAPVLHDANDKAGVIWAATGPSAGWKGARLELSRAGSAYEIGPTIDKPCTMGVLVETLPAANRYGLDTANALKVNLYPGARDLDGRTFEQLIASDDNALAIRYPDGKVEILQFITAVETAEREYTLTGLLRGRKDTTAGEHLAGAIVVLLDNNVRFVAIKPDDVGKTLNFRATSIDTDPDLAEVQTITMTTIESLREWQPYNIVVTPDSLGGYCVEWIGRARLGTSRTPVHSQWFEGYEVKFEVGTATYIVTTADQSVCVSAETLAAAFPSGYGTPVVTVRARSRVATNDDDFDSPPGGQTGGYDGSEAFALSGTIPGGYVGIPYDLRNGDAGITIGGGYWEAQAFGEICPGVGAYGQFPLSSTYRSVGIPTTAGTYTATIYADASSPVPGHAGTGTITNSVAIAAKPTYSTIDMRSRNTTRNTLVATTPPWTTFDVEAVSLYSYGFTVGKCRGEFTITNSDVALLVGVNAAYGDLAEGFRIGVQDGAPNQDAVLTTGDGTYAVEYDAATGDWEIFKAGAGSIATGNVPLPPGNQARIVCRPMSTDVVRVKANFGNEPWVITPSSGYGGIPMPTVTLPCAVGDHGTDTDIMRLGSGYIGATSGTNPRVINHTFGTLGKSSGRWRIGISGATWCGLAVAAYDSADGHLGASGTANSIGFNGTTLHWCFGGVHSSVTPTMPSATYRQIVFAPNFTAGTAVVLVEDFDGTQTPIHTIAGLPAGTWFPAESGSARIFTFTHTPAGPDGFTDWTTTV